MSINKTTGRPTRRKNALGRGLGALLEDSSRDTSRPEDSVREYSSINEIALENIEVNPFQPRSHFDREALQELADSIALQGIIQPITVRVIGTDRYQIISGERRVQASKLAGLTHIPAYVRKANDQQMLEMALIENIQREKLNGIEIALRCKRLLDECDLRQDQLGDRVGKNRSTVNNYLRLLKLPPDIQAALRDTRLTMGHARALINIDTIEQQLHIFNRTVEEDLSVRQVEALVRELAVPKKPKPAAGSTEMSPELQSIQSQLSSHFGTKVHIKSTGKEKGEIKIPYLSTEDLNRILELLQT
ncbi:MAG: ParB/RepB/Spo0J family partition protein [Cyclobacteriaceae bacterium]